MFREIIIVYSENHRKQNETVHCVDKMLNVKVSGEEGRAIAQAVSRRLPTASARVQTRVWSCGIL
jgi:hypothetical protein